uniref:Ribonuclease H-like domain-containing protein n=1 Tax=Tanacetum cinerariifolium TaxID=118510 RepID=A0A6L2N1Z5_TANCI|nr:ribonuclease H-like domain-containing protein [Tanacetum cinerariifolium]
MDTGASSHLNFNASNLSNVFGKRIFSSVHVGDDKSIPVTNTGHSIIPSHHRPLHLHNVLVTPNIVKHLISIRKFTRDNCTIEFDTFAYSLKDYMTCHILLRSSCPALLHQIIGSLNNEFDIIDLRALNYFLGIFADHIPTGLFLSQKKYALLLLERAHMVTCNPSCTPIDTESKLGPKGVPIKDPTLYSSLVEGLQYLTFTRKDLSYAVQQICLYMHDPREPHFAALTYLAICSGDCRFGLLLYVSATTSLVGYTDAD